MNYHQSGGEADEYIWSQIVSLEGTSFRTARGLAFSYHIKRNREGEQVGEMVIDRKEKTVTRATVLLAYQNAILRLAEEGRVSGPKKLGVFGASYLYPVFQAIGIFDGAASESVSRLSFLEDGGTADGNASENAEKEEKKLDNCAGMV